MRSALRMAANTRQCGAAHHGAHGCHRSLQGDQKRKVQAGEGLCPEEDQAAARRASAEHGS